MPDVTSAQLRAQEKRISGMLADLECVGELLLVGIGMARSVDLGDPPWQDGYMQMPVIAERSYGRRQLTSNILGAIRYTDQGNIRPKRRIRDIFFHDRRRYCPDIDGARSLHNVTCGRPMLRLEGLCGRSAAWDHRDRLVDPATGQIQTVGVCSQTKCRACWQDLLARNSAELKAHPAPQPAANTGGILERDLPEINWWKVWQRVDPDWAPPPEGERFLRPTLTLVINDAVEPIEAARPALVVHEGGWR